jgi:hypothetical protein
VTSQAYLGAIGRTRTTTVHVTARRGALVPVPVYTSVDATANPALAEQLRDGALNVVRLDRGELLRIAVAIVYHDPAARVLVLVLCEAHRHRELDERIRVLEQLRDDPAEVPAYAKDFAVVFGGPGLRAYLDHRPRGDARPDETDPFEPGPAIGDEPETGAYAAYAAEPDPDADPDPEFDGGAEVSGPLFDIEPAIDGEAALHGSLFDREGVDEGDAILDPAPRARGRRTPAGGAFDVDLEADLVIDAEPAFDAEPVSDAEAAINARPGFAAPADFAVINARPGFAAPADFAAAPAAGVARPPGGPAAGPGPHDLPGGTEAEDPESSAGGDPAVVAEAAGDEPAIDTEAAIEAESDTGSDGDGDPDRDGNPGGDPDEIELHAQDSAGHGDVHDGGDDDDRPGDARSGDDPLTTEVTELPVEPGEILPAADWYLDDSGVHVALAVDESLARALAGPLDVRLVLHRAVTAPVIAVVLGDPDALRAAEPGRFAIAVLDVAGERDRSVLRALSRRFELTAVLGTGGRAIRRCRLTAPLADNAGYVVRAADDHLRGIATYGEPDFARARDAVLDPAFDSAFDLLGISHPDRGELRADRLAQIATATQLRRALAIARHFTLPVREDYLVCTRGFPLSHWHQLRRDAVAQAVMWGLWMGPELAQIAVSEGLARSRRDLIVRLARGFDVLRHDRHVFDLDADATADNAAAIAEQARALGVELRARKPNDSGAIASDATPEASGSIMAPLPQRAPPEARGGAPGRAPGGARGGTPGGAPGGPPGRSPGGPPGGPPGRSIDELLAVLEDGAAGRGGRSPRVAAALELCDRGDPRAAQPVIAAALKMSRGEAVSVLARAVKLGPAAHSALIDGLASSKAYLRHGCALALALGRSDKATQAVIGLLRSEPTELWQEIARAIGEIGTPALVWLVRDIGQHGAAADERIALAMAHVAARGDGPALTTMAAADSIVSPIAARAVELLSTISGDRDGAGPGAGADRDGSVNHAFSRQFFEALDRDAAVATAAEVVARDTPRAVVES